MDTIHDLGGKQGFGPIPIGDDEPFDHSWERRMWAIARCGILPPGTIIDQFRHGLERMVPIDYLTLAYFNKWCANYYMLYVNAGVFTMTEVAAGRVDDPAELAPALSLDKVLDAQRNMATDFSLKTDTAPSFAIDDSVTTKRRIPANHTRLPAYARSATGIIIAHHGAHLLADKGADGTHEAEHLYTVAFAATELWGADADPRDSVTLELWECYFV